MAERKIIWSNRAKKRLYGILESSVNKDSTKENASKLHRLIAKKVKLLIRHPDLGITTTDKTAKVFADEDFLLFFDLTGERFVIHTINIK